MRQKVPATLPLFRSEAQVRLLAILALEPRRSWSLDELVAALGAPRPSVHRELQRALTAGLIARDASRRPHRFTADTESPLYPPLRQLLELTVGVELELRRLLEAEEGVEAAVIHGSWVDGGAGPHSDVDVLVIGRPDLTHLRRAARDVGRRAGRTIDVTAFTAEEFERRRDRADGFVAKLLAGPRIALTGDFDRLAA